MVIPLMPAANRHTFRSRPGVIRAGPSEEQIMPESYGGELTCDRETDDLPDEKNPNRGATNHRPEARRCSEYGGGDRYFVQQ